MGALYWGGPTAVAINSFPSEVLKSAFFKGGLDEQGLIVPPFIKGGLGGFVGFKDGEMTFEALAKLLIDHNCHSERSEESRIFRRLRSLSLLSG